MRHTVVLYPFRNGVSVALTSVGGLASVVLGAITASEGLDIGIAILSLVPVSLLVAGAASLLVRVRLEIDAERGQLRVSGPGVLRLRPRVHDLARVEGAVMEAHAFPRGTSYRLALVIGGEHMPLTSAYVQVAPHAQLARVKALLQAREP